MKKICSTLAIVCAFALTGWAQNDAPDYFTGDTTARIHAKPVNSVVFKQNKPKFGLEVGSSFATAGKYGSAFSNYVAPHFSIEATKNLTITAGVLFQNTQLYNVSVLTPEGLGKTNANVNGAFFYGKADYAISDRFTLTGKVLYGMNSTAYNSMLNTNNGLQATVNPLIYSIGGTYKITDNISVGFEVRGTQGVNRRQIGTGFSSDPLANGIGW